MKGVTGRKNGLNELDHERKKTVKNYITLIATTITLTMATSAYAGGSATLYSPYGGTASKSYSSNGTTATRSLNVQGAYGGSANVQGSCTKGAGCTRTWDRTLRNGATASGSVSAQRGYGVKRSGRGFRGRTW